MSSDTASEARASLSRLIDEAAASHRPTLVACKRNCAVVEAESDRAATQETLYLLGIPGMRDSIREGIAMPILDCSKDLGW